MGGLRRLALGAIGLVVLSAIGLILVAGGPEGLLKSIRALGARPLIYGFTALFVADLIRTLRLLAITRFEGDRVRFRTALIARLFGRFAGILTPAYTGSTPARAAVISAFDQVPPGRSMAVATVESVYDSLLPVAVTLVLTIPLLPRTWLPLLVAFFIVLLWVGGLGWGRTRSFESLVKKRLPERLACIVLTQREQFYSVLRANLRPRLVAPILALTILSHVIEATGVLAITLGVSAVLSSAAVIQSFIALEVTHVMVMSPTPGGALFFEYGVASVLPPEATVHWRIVYVLYSLLPGVILLVIFPRLREYARGLEKYGGDCDI